MKLKDEVETILRDYPKSRDSDINLMLLIWTKFYPHKIYSKDGIYSVRLKDIHDLPREDHIKRYRAKFNQQGLYLSSNPAIIKKRKQQSEKWLNDLEYGR